MLCPGLQEYGRGVGDLGRPKTWVGVRGEKPQSAAMGSHPYVLKDGPEKPKAPGPRADEGGEVLEPTDADRCTK
jgi:hypothetical protein